MEPLQLRPLFGGAAQIALPQRFADISDFRPIPDNQEVRQGRGWWRGAGSLRSGPRAPRWRTCPARLQVFADASLDQSLIVEIVVGWA